MPEAVVAEVIEWTPELIETMIRAKAESFGISPDKAVLISTRESTLDPNARGDMDIICDNPKSPFHEKPVEARGLWQLTKCYYPDVPDSVAYDPVLSTDFVMENGLLKEGVCEHQFSTCY